MDNPAYKDEITYTDRNETYKGYTIGLATSSSRSHPGKWEGHFKAVKTGKATLWGSLVESNPAVAQNFALRDAKAAVDKAAPEID